MKSNKYLICILFCTISLCLYSCQEDLYEVQSLNSVVQNTEPHETNKLVFGHALAKAMVDPEIRESFKKEALKKFDNDYDVLFQLVKDHKLQDGKTILERIASFSDNSNFEAVVEDNPLLTVFVPNLSHFSGETWDTSNEVPVIGVVNELDKDKGKGMIGFDTKGKVIELSYIKPPETPIVLVKDNERVMVDSEDYNPGLRARFDKSKSSKLTDTKHGSLVFIDEIFDSRVKHSPSERRSSYTPAPRTPSSSSGDPVIEQAKGLNSPRDYVYYGIAPELGVNEGSFNNRYKEYITSFKMKSMSSINNWYNDPASDYTDGELEFVIEIVYINNQGGLDNTTKVLSINRAELERMGGRCQCIPSGSPRTVTVNEAIIPWDFRRYGDTWKFIVIEHDQAGEEEYTTKVESKFGLNFKSNGEKEGSVFGGEASFTKSNTYTFKTTIASDRLGEAILFFDDPLVLEKPSSRRRSGTVQVPYTISTGTIELTVQPKKWR